ncbi:NUDIX domain-containing protein [Cardinium endosymbiont of Philonthus spinipes]|uniref:NUDIX domain-containing protein n=1 Tax=Cardinium endosymbiont of Philonthus spinipes TaxID=3077941 RepID=UPI00313BB3F4
MYNHTLAQFTYFKLKMRTVLFEEGMFAFDPLFIDHFSPTNAIATCYMVCNEKVLLLKREDGAILGNRWCMAGGKLEKNETPLQAVIREVAEEVGIILLPEQVAFIQTIYIRIFASKQDYILHLFKAVFSGSEPSDYKVTLNQEHTDYLWVDLQAAKQLNLIPGGYEVLEYMQHHH